MSKKRSFVPGRASRFFKLSGLTSQISSRYTTQRIKELFMPGDQKAASRTLAHVQNAEQIVKTLGELKGAVMKVGQYMSIQNDLLPKEFADVLASLQKSAPPVDYELVEAQVTGEFGKTPEALFARFDKEPYASASIGQVHRARLADGTEVVVKVQYPGVEENIEGDLKNLKTILSTGAMMGYRKGDLDEVFAEVRDRLYEELDYWQELENLKAFRELASGDPRVTTPRPFPSYSSRKVLTLSYLPGDPMDALLAPPYTQQDRNRFGHLIVDLFACQLLNWGVLHADPHPGNFAFSKDGRMLLYDFGCLKRIPPDIREACRDLAVCGMENNCDGVDDALLRMGSRDPDKPPVETDFYAKFMDVLREPISEDKPYDFSRIEAHKKMMELAPLGFSKMLHFKPCPEAVFINRTLIGHYGNLKNLKATANWRSILAPYL